MRACARVCSYVFCLLSSTFRNASGIGSKEGKSEIKKRCVERKMTTAVEEGVMASINAATAVASLVGSVLVLVASVRSGEASSKVIRIGIKC